MGRTATEPGLADCLEGEPARTLQAAFPGGLGRWNLRRSIFRQGGRPHQLLVLADLSRALRKEKRQAWQRLIRVLGSLRPCWSQPKRKSSASSRKARAARGDYALAPAGCVCWYQPSSPSPCW
jgi:hypothetical protein